MAIRRLFAFIGVIALCAAAVAFCGDSGANVCEGVVCDDGNACTEDICDPYDGSCDSTAVADDSACNVQRGYRAYVGRACAKTQGSVRVLYATTVINVPKAFATLPTAAVSILRSRTTPPATSTGSPAYVCRGRVKTQCSVRGSCVITRARSTNRPAILSPAHVRPQRHSQQRA